MTVSQEGAFDFLKAAAKGIKNKLVEGVRAIGYAFSSIGLMELRYLEKALSEKQGHKKVNDFVNAKLAARISINGELVSSIFPDINRKYLSALNATVAAGMDQSKFLRETLNRIEESGAVISRKAGDNFGRNDRDLKADEDKIHDLLVTEARRAHRRGYWAPEVSAFSEVFLADNRVYLAGEYDALTLDVRRVYDQDSRKLAELLKACPGKLPYATKAGRTGSTRIVVPEFEELASILRSAITVGNELVNLWKNVHSMAGADQLEDLFTTLSSDEVFEIVDEETGEVLGELVSVEVTPDDAKRARLLAHYYGNELNNPCGALYRLAKIGLVQVRNQAEFVRTCLKYYN